MNYPIKRTPEQGHTKACLAKAITTVLENWRDDSSVTDFDFRIHLQENGPLDEADSYLRDGLTECLCPPIEETCDACGSRPAGHGHFARYCEPCSVLPYGQAAPVEVTR